MGAWGTGSLDNDTACDWAYDLKKSDEFTDWKASVRDLSNRLRTYESDRKGRNEL
jgi:hypothetical protein